MSLYPLLVAAPAQTTVGDLAIESPKTLPPTATVHDVRDEFRDDHVHMVLLSSDTQLHGCLVRGDLVGVPDSAPALSASALRGRTISAGQPIDAAWEILDRTGARRLAVVDDANRLLGLLCLKRSRSGFCSDADVASRAAELAVTAALVDNPSMAEALGTPS